MALAKELWPYARRGGIQYVERIQFLEHASAGLRAYAAGAYAGPASAGVGVASARGREARAEAMLGRLLADRSVVVGEESRLRPKPLLLSLLSTADFGIVERLSFVFQLYDSGVPP